MKMKDVIKFIRENDIDHEHWSDQELAQGIINAISGEAFGYVCNDDGTIKGIYMGKWLEPFTTFQIIVIVGKGAFRDLLKLFRTRFPLCKKFTGYRHTHSVNGKYENGKVKYVEYSNSTL